MAAKTVRKARKRRGKKHTHWGQVKSHRRRVNPRTKIVYRSKAKKRRKLRHARRSNPFSFKGLLGPVMEYGVGFAAGSLANTFAIQPALDKYLGEYRAAHGPVKMLVGPLLGSLVAKYAPGSVGKVGRAMGLFLLAKGVDETLNNLLPAVKAGAGIGVFGRMNGMASIGPTRTAGIASIGPTTSRGLGDVYTSDQYQSQQY